MSELNLVDSSGWLEFFVDSDRAGLYQPAIVSIETMVVPTVVIYEVFKRLRNQWSEEAARDTSNYMKLGRVVDLDIRIALEAACNGLPFADSIIYATARQLGATLWTQDAHFEGRPGVKYFAKT